MKEIGGYLDISANWKLRSLDSDPVMLNSSRNCIRYIARQRKIKRIFIPYYSCDTVVEALNREAVKIEFYGIDSDFKPLLPDDFNDEHLLYVNYYGLMDDVVHELVEKYKNIIVDNAQAYFSRPIPGVATVSSPRKFFGLPDGGLLYPRDEFLITDLPSDKSSSRMSPLLKRVENDATSAYDETLLLRKNLNELDIMQMSEMTQLLLGSVDEEFAKVKRRSNWKLLDKYLKEDNRLNLTMGVDEVPLFYPYLSNSKELRAYLVANKIYVGTYWPGVKENVTTDSVEYDLVENLVPLPIDQRYDEDDMQRIVQLIDAIQC